MNSRDMYREHILELFRNPEHRGALKSTTHTHREHNPLCGDDVTIHLNVEKKTIKEGRFEGSGCAICIAATELLLEKITGKSTEELMRMKKEDIIELMGIPLSPVRLKCALLGLETAQKALIGGEQK